MSRRAKPTPEALRLRALMIAHTCALITEQGAMNRVIRLLDTHVRRCAWCGTWTDCLSEGIPSCPRCTPKLTDQEPPQ